MKMKYYYVIFVIIIGLLILDYLFYAPQKIVDQKLKHQTDVSISQISNSALLCDESYEGCKAAWIQQCKDANDQNIYTIGFACTDMPLKYFDSQFRYIATCGGMPLPSGGQYESSDICRVVIKCSNNTVFCKQG